ncbi:hypothetical protein ACQPZX_03040 [Actinoplanes sp. CA-142083]|uniref:hypothetical protein n=1 Tax=Actinoplanes sp. CA-142083 TaxID=3239903 RepID=UPI003D8A0E47
MGFLDRLGRKPMVIVAGWILAAVLAILVGVVGVGVVGAGLTSRQGTPISQEEVLRALGESSPTPHVSEMSSAPIASKQSFSTRGGTVVATCERILTMAPAQGFAIHEQNDREGEFRGVSDNHDRVKVELSCAAGTPQLRIRSED